MATVRRQITTRAKPDDVWDAIRDIGALHTRLVAGFVTDTRLEPGARIVTFASGAVIREPIVSIEESQRRLVWSAESPRLRHYNASVQAFAAGEGTTVVWTADFLPDEATEAVDALMASGMAAMQRSLDALG